MGRHKLRNNVCQAPGVQTAAQHKQQLPPASCPPPVCCGTMRMMVLAGVERGANGLEGSNPYGPAARAALVVNARASAGRSGGGERLRKWDRRAARQGWLINWRSPCSPQTQAGGAEEQAAARVWLAHQRA